MSDGGIAVALAECCIMNPESETGCEIDFEYKGRKDFQLFAETQSSIIVTADQINIKKISELAEKFQISLAKVGETKGNRLKINFEIDLPLREVKEAYYNTIGNIMDS